ncbi:MAG: YceK/YidQ family lipoprotein [Spirochaetota bacterium]
MKSLKNVLLVLIVSYFTVSCSSLNIRSGNIKTSVPYPSLFPGVKNDMDVLSSLSDPKKYDCCAGLGKTLYPILMPIVFVLAVPFVAIDLFLSAILDIVLVPYDLYRIAVE